MARLNLQQYVSYLYNIGKTTREVYQSIKKRSGLKFTTNNSIQDAIDSFLRASEAARRFEQYKNTSKIDRTKYDGWDKKHNKVCIEYTFDYDTSASAPRSSTTRGGGDFIIEIDKGVTKQDVMDAIKSKIDSWIDEHYEGKSKRKAFNTVNLKTIRAC